MVSIEFQYLNIFMLLTYFKAFLVGHIMSNIGVIETLVHPRKTKNKDTHMPSLCAHSMWSMAKTGLFSDLHGPE